jgi:hypothetical protein
VQVYNKEYTALINADMDLELVKIKFKEIDNIIFDEGPEAELIMLQGIPLKEVLNSKLAVIGTKLDSIEDSTIYLAPAVFSSTNS